LKGEAQDRTEWRARCGRGYGPAVRHATGLMYPATAVEIMARRTLTFSYTQDSLLLYSDTFICHSS